MIDQAGINDAHYTLWAKSHAGDGPVPLLQHLFDAAAVSELMWEEYLAPSVRSWIDTSAGGRGKTSSPSSAGFTMSARLRRPFSRKIQNSRSACGRRVLRGEASPQGSSSGITHALAAISSGGFYCKRVGMTAWLIGCGRCSPAITAACRAPVV